MMPKKLWVGLGAMGVTTSLLLGTSLSQAASIDDPSIEDAYAALERIDQEQETIRNYLDSVSPAPTPSASVTPSSEPTGSPAVQGPPRNIEAQVGDGRIVLSWEPPLGDAPIGFAYGRGGEDRDGYGAYNSEVLPATLRSATLDKLVNGREYPVYVEAVYEGDVRKRVALSATPVGGSGPSPSATPSSTPTASPGGGSNLSGMPYSSGVWANGDRARTEAFVAGPRQGIPIDNQLVYTYRNSQAAQNNPIAWRSQLPTNWDPARQTFVLALTTWTGDGASMTAAQATAIGQSVCAIDNSKPIVRLDWEMNLQDGAGVNGAVLTASNYSQWVDRFRTAATALKAACPGLLIDFNPNVGADQTTGCNTGSYAAPNNCSRKAFQELKNVIDIFGLDTYDSWPPVGANGAGWSARINPNAFGSLENSRLYALANGKKFSVPEWGLGCNTSGCQWQGNAGGDDPEYIKRMIAYFDEHAEDIAYETIFDESASYIKNSLIDQNPNSRAQYGTSIKATR